ncbi:hypothetical protein [Fulvivirga lutimaris]|uniref:hypothetical protein n=1 Tax=Fulvivirga lutimaris TaxID=1819566 RepID=UPI0012BD59AB|nr:hypothetical protein [Fulvivirga lutimaris]MTI41794.1 hypothetical protein [Fulvivirga lutimaris]
MRLIILLLFATTAALAQPDTEVYVFDLNSTNGKYEVSNPINVSNKNEGYDNQPHFTPESNLMYTSTQDGQTDVALYDFDKKTNEYLINTRANEYSPTPVYGEKSFSCIYDSMQYLVKYLPNKKEPVVLIDDLVVGYHCWADANTVLLFVLGDTFTLRKYNLKKKTNEIMDDNIGRCLLNIPNKPLISYVSKKTSPFAINSIDPKTGIKVKIADALEGSEDLAWTPESIMIMGQGDVLHQYDNEKGWMPIADLKEFGLSGISRLAVSPQGDKLAVVVSGF